MIKGLHGPTFGAVSYPYPPFSFRSVRFSASLRNHGFKAIQTIELRCDRKSELPLSRHNCLRTLSNWTFLLKRKRFLADVHESSRSKSCHCCNRTGVGESLGEDKRGHVSPASLPEPEFERSKSKISSTDRCSSPQTCKSRAIAVV